MDHVEIIKNKMEGDEIVMSVPSKKEAAEFLKLMKKVSQRHDIPKLISNKKK